MQTSYAVWLAVILFLSTMPDAIAQPVGDDQFIMEQAIQNNSRMLADVHANPQAKLRALERMKERLKQRGIADIEARLNAVEKIFDEAVSMSDTDFGKNQKQLAMRIIAQVRPAGGQPQSGNGNASATSNAGTTPSRTTGGSVARPTKTIPWVDVHNHLIPDQRRNFNEAINAALAIMDKIGISTMIVMPPPQNTARYDYDAFVAALRLHSARFAFLGGGESLNVMLQQARNQTVVTEGLKRQFQQKAEEILGQGAAGFGEMAVHHLSLHGDDHPYESVPADHPLMLLLADIAAQHDVPIDIHFDVVTRDMPTPEWLSSPNNPKVLHANLASFERLLYHNPKAKICWAHAGSDHIGHWTADLSRTLMQKHPNLYMSLRLGPGHAPENFPLTQDGQIKPEWLQLLKDFSKRFVIGSDNFIASNTFQGSGTVATLVNRIPVTRTWTPVFLNALSPDLSRAIASENSITLYKLKH